MDLSKLTKGDRIVLVAGLLLIIDLLFFPWHNYKASALGFSVSVKRSGVQSPESFYGVLALLIAIVMAGQIVVAKFTTAKLPALPIPWSRIHLIAGAAAFVLLLLKLLVNTDYLSFGAYLGILLGAGLAFGGFTISKEPEVSPGFRA